MMVWLWDAAGTGGWRGLGISDDLATAMRAAEGCLLGGLAQSARIEAARDALDPLTLEICYQRMGHGWQAQHGAGGTVTWRELAPSSPPWLAALRDASGISGRTPRTPGQSRC